MGFFDFLRSSKATNGAASTSAFAYAALGDSPRRGTAELIALYNQSPALRKVLDRIAGSEGQTKWQLYRKKGAVIGRGKHSTAYAGADDRHKALTGKNWDKALVSGQASPAELGYTEVTDHPVLTLLRRPNPNMHGHALLKLVQIYLDLKGESFVQKIRLSPDSDEISALYAIPPHWVNATPSDANDTFNATFVNKSVQIPSRDMLWLKHADPVNPYGRGSGFGDALSDELDTDLETAKYLKSFFRNRGKPDALISIENVKSEDQLRQAKTAFENQNRGRDRGHRVHFTSGKVQVTEFGKSFKDQEMTQLRDFEQDIVREVYGVPPEIFGQLDTSNRATITNALRIYFTLCIVPRVEWLRQDLQFFLVDDYDPSLVLHYVNPVPDDREFQLDALKAKPEAFSINEWRAFGGQASIGEDGDSYIVQMQDIAVSSFADMLQDERGTAETDTSAKAESTATNGVSQSVQDEALNGAQVASLIQIISDVAASVIPRDAGLEALKLAFQLDDAEAESVMGSAGSTFFSTPADTIDSAQRSLGAIKAKSKSTKADGSGDPAIERVVDALSADRMTAEIDPLFEARVSKWAQSALDDLGIDASFDMQNPAVKEYLASLSGTDIKDITDTTRSSLRDTLVEGFRNGEDIDELTARVRDIFGGDIARARAENIARSEVTRAANFATKQAYKQSGVVDRKQWVSTLDDRTRPEHLEINGQIKGLEEPFEVDGELADHPGDFGDPRMDCQCRCTIVAVVADIDQSAFDEVDALITEEIDGGSAGEERSAKPEFSVEKGWNNAALGAFWKNFDAKTLPWEAQTKRAVHRALRRQMADVLKVLRHLYGTLKTP